MRQARADWQRQGRAHGVLADALGIAPQHQSDRRAPRLEHGRHSGGSRGRAHPVHADEQGLVDPSERDLAGLVLDKLLPGLLYVRDTMQIAHMIHAAAAVLMMAMFIGHIYIGTIGMQGAYQGMRTGYVDETWAREHHEFWYDDIKAGKIPAQRTQAAQPTQTVQI